MPEVTKAQPWKAVWPTSTTTEKDGRVQHFKLSGSKSAEVGYKDEVKAEEATSEQK